MLDENQASKWYSEYEAKYTKIKTHKLTEYLRGPSYIIGEGNGNPLQYSCLENSMDWAAW